MLKVRSAIVKPSEDLETGRFDATFAIVSIVEPSHILFCTEIFFLKPFFQWLKIFPHSGTIQS